PRHFAGRLAAGVAQLDPDLDRGMLADRVDDRLQRGGVLVGPQSEIAIGDAPFRRDRGRLQDHHRGAGQREMAEVDHVPVGRQAVFGGILAHRRDGDAVG
nr:hypothetical protein [Tanacetum cinerariifolium]